MLNLSSFLESGTIYINEVACPQKGKGFVTSPSILEAFPCLRTLSQANLILCLPSGVEEWKVP